MRKFRKKQSELILRREKKVKEKEPIKEKHRRNGEGQKRLR